jgi:predicted aspartyl protease
MSSVECGFQSTATDHGSAILAFSGPTIDVNIGLDPAWLPTSTTPPNPSVSRIKALVDTGATESCIDQLLASKLGLPVVDIRPFGGIGGTHMANMYLAQIHVPALGFTQYAMSAGVDHTGGGQSHEALIGRTFLLHFHMVYAGNTGSVTLTRTP